MPGYPVRARILFLSEHKTRMSERKSGERSRRADASRIEAVGSWDTCSQTYRRIEALATLAGIYKMYRAASFGLLSRKILLQMELEQLSRESAPTAKAVERGLRHTTQRYPNREGGLHKFMDIVG